MDNINKKRLQPIRMIGSVFNVIDIEKFHSGLALIKESLFDKGATLYASDNVITWNRNLSFARDPFLSEILKGSDASGEEKTIIWRTYILLYFAKHALQADGDFVELGCYKGYTASQVIKKLNLPNIGKKYFLYDLFEWKPGDAHTKLSGHSKDDLHEYVVDRFSNYDSVKVIKGRVPDSLDGTLPDKICFCHIDMNNAEAEYGGLTEILPRLQSGGVVILDDYGWWWYSAQKIAMDPVIFENGLDVLELPTGQGLILKP